MARTPVIALTAHALVGDRDKVLEAGMDDYAAKPVKPRVLGRLLAHWIPAASAGAPPGPAEALPPRLPVPSLSAAEPGNDGPAGLSSGRGDERATVHEPEGASGEDLPVLDPDMHRPARAVELFVGNMPAEAETLRAHAAAADAAGVREVSHRMKGACLSLGVDACGALCASAELSAREGDIDLETVSAIGRAVVAAIEALQQAHGACDRVESA